MGLSCDSGATAVDASDGSLTSRIEICSTEENQILYTSNIPLFIACRVDPYIPGEYPIDYSVTNSKGLKSSVTRQLVIKPFCPPGEHVCSNTVQIYDREPFMPVYLSIHQTENYSQRVEHVAKK